ncbi:MAG: hypothetical protein L6416_03675 [Candidatus Omnitrophica bacterium]|nr:hypothetical protein [Candidatus Omnitrophota bacterium]
MKYKYIVIITFLIPLCIILGCQNNNQTLKQSNPVVDESFQLNENANPIEDAKIAIENNDLRFVGLRGYVPIVPGVPDYHKIYSDKFGVKLVIGTSDFLTPEVVRINKLAHKYALEYNKLILKQIQNKDPNKALQ